MPHSVRGAVSPRLARSAFNQGIGAGRKAPACRLPPRYRFQRRIGHGGDLCDPAKRGNHFARGLQTSARHGGVIIHDPWNLKAHKRLIDFWRQNGNFSCMGTSGRKYIKSTEPPPRGRSPSPAKKKKPAEVFVQPAEVFVQTEGGPVLIIDPVAVGQRLRQIREYMGYPVAKHFAEERMQALDSTWGAYETGRTVLPIAMAIKLIKQCPGLSLDWIYRRRADGLSAALWRAFGMPSDAFD